MLTYKEIKKDSNLMRPVRRNLCLGTGNTDKRHNKHVYTLYKHLLWAVVESSRKPKSNVNINNIIIWILIVQCIIKKVYVLINNSIWRHVAVSVAYLNSYITDALIIKINYLLHYYYIPFKTIPFYILFKTHLFSLRIAKCMLA